MQSIEALGQRWHDIHDVLSAGVRRQIIGSLGEAPPDRALSLPEAANLPNYRLDPERLAHDLVHHHLPKMEAAGFVQWGKEPFTVSRGERFEDVASVLEAIDESERLPDHLRANCHYLEQGGHR